MKSASFAESPPASPLSSARILEVRASRAAWFTSLQAINVPLAPVAVTVGVFTAESSAATSSAPLADDWFVIRKTAS